tara:strand:+ start:1619 stop:1843 length:225 start_codon:yes stop_codon:yes gene_type:complete
MYGQSTPVKKSTTRKPPAKKPATKSKKLTEAQEKRLQKHSVHHSKKHINMMRKDMMMGMSFKMAHNKAQKSVGK